ncbi:MAG: DUF4132 domain-containing protein [Bacteroidota bacterium]
MTTKELIDSFKQEFKERRKAGEWHFDMRRKGELFSFAYVDKHFSQEEKEMFCRDAIIETFHFFEEKKQFLIEQGSELEYPAVQRLNEEVDAYKLLFSFCVRDAAKILKEDDLLAFSGYYTHYHRVRFHRAHNNGYMDFNLSEKLIDFDCFLDLVAEFRQHHPMSSRLLQRVKHFRKSHLMKSGYGRDSTVHDIIQGKASARNFGEAEGKRYPLQARAILLGKQWKWLREKVPSFTTKEADFYELVEQLSHINYFNVYAIQPEQAAVIKAIRPKYYEVFMLDLYQEVTRKGSKRSGWFMGEKVVAFQIFVWLMYHLGTPNTYVILTNLAEKCFTKIPRLGPTSRKLGDVVLKILEESETVQGLGVLLNLQGKAKYPVFKEALKGSVRRAIGFTQLDPSEVEDYFIDDFGLKNGEVACGFGAFRSHIRIEGDRKVNLIWLKPDGKTQKSVPAKVKSAYPSAVKLWKAKQKHIKKELASHKQRIERFWCRNKQWSYSNWEQHLINHELLRYIYRELIWEFRGKENSTAAIWQDGEMVDSTGSTICISDESRVSLWHPSKATVEEIQAWRTFITNREIKQPFKQAFREVYLVTDAEVATSTYSNRFANHVVRHHKFAALAKQRNWTYRNVYAQHDPYIEYPEYAIVATLDIESWYDLAGTGRVHFRNTDTNEALQMEEVPTMVFSETMRDVDLFIGVCSIGIEEEWRQNQHMNYWRKYSSADLSETAKTRRSVLGNMLPKLAIKDQCEITDNYLVVNGNVRTYKIHFGSGNILMEPNDQYLCIVPDTRAQMRDNRVFLPFDDDATFSIILSKAFLLANDDKIEDRVILNQIH